MPKSATCNILIKDYGSVTAVRHKQFKYGIFASSIVDIQSASPRTLFEMRIMPDGRRDKYLCTLKSNCTKHYDMSSFQESIGKAFAGIKT